MIVKEPKKVVETYGNNNMVARAVLRITYEIWLAVLTLCALLFGLYSYNEDGYRTSVPVHLRYRIGGKTSSRIQPLSLNSSLTKEIWNFKTPEIEQIYLLKTLLSKKHFFNVTNVEILKIELRRKMGTFFTNHLIVDQQNTPKNYTFTFGSKDKPQSVQISEDIHKLLPNKVEFDDIPRCSVVGNSGIISNSRCGEDIDRADFVFRCNAAPIKAFADDAGNKTNFTTLNPSILQLRYNELAKPKSVSQFLTDMKEYRGILWVPCFTFADMKKCIEAMKIYENSENKFVLGYPGHSQKVHDFWESCGLQKRVTTGLYLLTVALSRCREVHLFGFWPFSKMIDTTLKDISYHYFDKTKYNFNDKHGIHDMHLEFSVLVQLHSLGVVKLHVGACNN